jgi:hypothetical protein
VGVNLVYESNLGIYASDLKFMRRYREVMRRN